MEYFLKAQNIIDVKNIKPYSLSVAHEFESAEENIAKKRGRLFIVLSIATIPDKFNLELAVKLFLDRVQDEYFRAGEDTPLHAIEKAIQKAHKELLLTKSDDETMTLESAEADLSFSLATALIWNSVLYTSKLGKPAVYLVRGTGIRNLNTIKESQEIWTSSSILANGDVILIGTEKFGEKFPVDQISQNMGGLATSISQIENNSLIAATLIKVENKEKASKSGKIKAIIDDNIARNYMSGVVSNIRSKIFDKTSLSDKFKPYQAKKTAPVSSINTLISGSTQSVDISGRTIPKRLSKGSKNYGSQKKIITGLIMLIAFGIINYNLIGKKMIDTPSPSDITSQISQESTVNKAVMGVETQPSLHPTLLNLAYSSENMIDFSSDFSKNIYTISSNSFYEINYESKESKEIVNNLEKARYIACDRNLTANPKNLCYIFTENKIIVINPAEINKKDEYPVELSNVLDIYPYENSLYILNYENIYKQTLLKDTPEKWMAEEVIFPSEPKAIAIDSNIYLLAGRNVYKYVNGKQVETFDIKDNSYLLNPIDIDVYKEKLFILDTPDNGDKYIVIYNKNTGEYIERYLLSEKTDLEAITGFIIYGKNEELIFNKGRKLYSVDKTKVENTN